MTAKEMFEIDVALVQKARDAFAAGDWAFCFQALDTLLRAKRRCGEDEWLEWVNDHLNRSARGYRNHLYKETLLSWKAGEFTSREAMLEKLELRAFDMLSCQDVALAYIRVSGNRDACLEVHDDVPTTNTYIEWSVIAAAALRADVLEDLFDDHITDDAEPLQVPNGWCDGCDCWKPEREGFPLGEYVCAECSEP